MSKALLICNGENFPALLKRLAKEADLILAADAGADAALKAGLIPNAVIGDLDSASPRARRTLKNVPFIQVARQDNTDFDKALHWLARKKFTACAVAGAAGKRLDFTVGNLLAAFAYAKRMDIVFHGDGWIMRPLARGLKFTARPGARMSLLPLSACKGVTLKGFKYPLQNAHWKAGLTMGTSNEVCAKHCEVSFASGRLLMYLED